MSVSVVVCAAGKGERAELGINKVLAPLCGSPVLYHTLKKFSGEYAEIIVTSSPRDREEIAAVCAPFRAKVVTGGETRTESVYNALKHVTGDIVLIHDGARPFVTEKIVADCIACVKAHGSGICALPVTDTVAECGGGEILNVPPRSALYNLQTPQGFFTRDIKKAYGLAKASGQTFTDDSSVYAAFIGRPHVFVGDARNKKLTYKSDFTDVPPPMQAEGGRIGYGIDVHAFGAPKDYVVLCGERIPCDSGLVAHSDGDVAVHAVMDALLSAAGKKDIGHYFPDTDPKYRGADSMTLLRSVIGLLREEGYSVGNISLAVQAEKPRLASHIDDMKRNLSRAAGVPFQNVAIAAGTSEHLGFVGEGLGICAACAVTLKERFL